MKCARCRRDTFVGAPCPFCGFVNLPGMISPAELKRQGTIRGLWISGAIIVAVLALMVVGTLAYIIANPGSIKIDLARDIKRASSESHVLAALGSPTTEVASPAPDGIAAETMAWGNDDTSVTVQFWDGAAVYVEGGHGAPGTHVSTFEHDWRDEALSQRHESKQDYSEPTGPSHGSFGVGGR